LRDEFLSATKRLVDSKVATENALYAKKDMETQYQKYDDFILNMLNLTKSFDVD